MVVQGHQGKIPLKSLSPALLMIGKKDVCLSATVFMLDKLIAVK